MSKRCVIPVSGGLDSTVIAHWAKADGFECHALMYDYGQKHRARELTCASMQALKTCKTQKQIDLSFFKQIVNTSSLTNDDIEVAKTRDVLGDPQTVNYVPNRNMMMLSIATAYAEAIGADTVMHGSALVDSQAGYWDGSKEFIQAINNVVDLNRRNKIKISAPLIMKSKQDIIQMGVNSGVDFAQTWTCYEGKDKACGVCTACSSRIKGFIDNKMIDPVQYAIDIPWEKYGCKEI